MPVFASTTKATKRLRERFQVRDQLREYIVTALIRNGNYPLADDEGLLSGGLIDLAALEDLALFLNESFGIIVDEAELATENIDTLDELVTLIHQRLE